MSTQQRKTQDLDDVETRGLRQLLGWLAVITFAATPVELLLALVFSSLVVLIVAGISALMGLTTLAALMFVRRGQKAAASFIVGGGLLLAAVIVAVMVPTIATGLSLVPVLVFCLLLPFLPAGSVRLVGVACGIAAPVMFALNNLPPLLPPPPPIAAQVVATIAVATACGLTLLLLGQNSARLVAIVGQVRGANAALEQARATLEQQVATRTADLRIALTDVQARAATQESLLAENAQQREAIREMSVPVLPVGEDAIVIPLVGALDSQRLQAVQEQALAAIENQRARYLILDITGVPVVDTHVAQGLLDVVQGARLLGSETVLVGVRPEVAQTVVTLGLDLRTITTRQSLQEGIAYTLQQRV